MKRALITVALLAAAPSAAQTDVDQLIANGRLQEAAWAARAAGDTARASLLLARLDSVLRSTPWSAKPLDLDKQGVSYTFRLQHGHGIDAIFKVDGSDIFCPTCGAAREVAVYRIDQLLGFDLTPLTVFQTITESGRELEGSSMYFVHGASRPGDRGIAKPDALRLFDAIIGNSDRHNANWLALPEGGIVAIDHNRAFEYRPSTRPKTCWETQIDSLTAPGRLGPPFERYRTLPADSLRAALADILDPQHVQAFVAMRDRVVDRIERRARQPNRRLPREACPWEE